MTQLTTPPPRPAPPEEPPVEPWLDDLEEEMYQTEHEPHPAEHRLRRSRTDRMIGGVCGGLGEYLGIDPVLLRLAFVLLAFGGGSGVLLYVIALIVIPEAAPGETVEPGPRSNRNTAALIVGAAFITLGGMFLLRETVGWFNDRVVLAAALIIVGLLIAVRGVRR